MATGLFVTDDGNVMVDYGKKKIRIPLAEYKANGYRPRFEELMLRAQAERRLRSVPQSEQEMSSNSARAQKKDHEHDETETERREQKSGQMSRPTSAPDKRMLAAAIQRGRLDRRRCAPSVAS